MQVKTGVFVQSLLAVNENSYSFDLNLIWVRHSNHVSVFSGLSQSARLGEWRITCNVFQLDFTGHETAGLANIGAAQNLEYQDPRAYDIIMNSDSDQCNYYCSSLPNSVLNAEGDSACCEGVFVPQVGRIWRLSPVLLFTMPVGLLVKMSNVLALTECC